MESTKPSRLFVTSSIEARDESDEKYDRFYDVVHNVIADVSEKEAHDALNAMVCKGLQNHEEVSLGLVVGILSEPEMFERYYRDLTLITRDGLGVIMTHLNQLVIEKYSRLQDRVKTQLLLFVKEMMRNSVANIDGLCYNLLRQIAGGDISPRNMWLAESVLDMFLENRAWLEKFPVLLATVVYTYLRLIVDHGAPMFTTLLQKETDFVVSLLRDKFTECMMIGRDLVRLLQNVARVPEFERLWRDVVLQPAVLSPTFTGVLQLLMQRTSRRFLQSRLTPDMEKKIGFLTSQVRFGNHKRYQDWFQKQYLSTPESQSLRCDLIRFIVGVIHPTNELLCSDIIPRWAVIGWLLTTCTSNVAASNAKLSLFYDWLFFDPERDNIMNIEPAILVMHHSLRPHPAITVTLLDFLCRIIPNFCPSLTDRVRAGIFTSLKQILEKRVLPSLSPLFDNTKLDKELRNMIRETFAEFCSASDVKLEDSTTKEVSEIVMLDPQTDDNAHEAEFSDDEDDMPLAKVRLRDLKFKPIEDQKKSDNLADFSEFLELVDEDLRTLVVQLQQERDTEVACEVMEKLTQTVIQLDDFDQEHASNLSACLCRVLDEHFAQRIFPQVVDDESLEDSIGSPLFVVFRNLCQMAEEDPSRQPILLLLTEMYERQPKLGYRLLYFLKASKLNDDKMSAYRDFCKSQDSKDLDSCLKHDLQLCQDEDIRLLCYLIPDIYAQFPNVALGNSELLNLIVACIDSSQLQDFICHILQGNLVMFRKDSFLSVLNASLEWETFEQYCLWQLIAAHNIPVDYILPILPKLEFGMHAEALTSILLLLKQEKPSPELIKHIMFREVKPLDVFVVSVLRYWSQEHEEKLADLVASQLSKLTTSPSKRKRQNNAKASQVTTVDQMLCHLDHLRQHCRQTSFFNNDTLKQALQNVQASCSEAQQTKFSDLFSLAEDVEDAKPQKARSGRKSGALKSKATTARPFSDTSSEGSEEDEVMRPKAAKKRRKAVGSDSD